MIGRGGLKIHEKPPLNEKDLLKHARRIEFSEATEAIVPNQIERRAGCDCDCRTGFSALLGRAKIYNRVIQTVWHTDRFATDEPSIFSRDATVAAVLTALGKRGVVFLNRGVALAS